MEVKIYTTPWCPDCRMAKRFLNDWKIRFEEIDIDQDPAAAEFVLSVNGGRRKVPTLVVGEKVFDCSPFDVEKLKDGLGLSSS